MGTSDVTDARLLARLSHHEVALLLASSAAPATGEQGRQQAPRVMTSNNSGNNSASGGGNSLAVNVSIEASDEYQVQEITYDGQEKYVQPLSMSENLSRLAQRIDFTTASEDIEQPMDEDSSSASESKDPSASFQPSLWPWDSVRNKLKYVLSCLRPLLRD